MISIKSDLDNYYLGESREATVFKANYKMYKYLLYNLTIRGYKEKNRRERLKYMQRIKYAEDKMIESLRKLNRQRISIGKEPILLDGYNKYYLIDG